MSLAASSETGLGCGVVGYWSVAAQVQHRIEAVSCEDIPVMSGMASALAMSTRTLRRKLQQEGTSYTALCEQTRAAAAEQLLVMHRLPIQRVAYLLGFSESASFIRAFKRWKGQTPCAYRAARFQTRISAQIDCSQE